MLVLIAFLLAADQMSKFLVRRWTVPYESTGVLPFFSIENVQNSGIAFGMLKGHTGLVIFTSTAIVLLLVVTAMAIMQDPRFIWPLAFLVAGSMGNLIDRFSFGYVTDFLHFPHWPAFNLADIFIIIGAALLIRVFLLLSGKEEDDGSGDVSTAA